MLNFEFYNPTKIVFGKDRIKDLNELVPTNAKVIILYGGGSVKKFGTLDKVKAALGERAVFEFGGIEANPKYDTLMKAVEIVKTEKIDFLLAVGGGSVMDGTKFISLASTYVGEDAKDILRMGTVSEELAKGISIGNVVTLPATGSEMNNGGVITSDLGKLPIFSITAYPNFSILDPELTYSLPATQVANGVVDTFIHVLEQYATYPVDARFQDRTAEGILLTLKEIGKKTIDEPSDYDARANLVWCATMGLNGLIGSGVPQDWATHMIGHELTLLFGIDHGKTLAVVLPALWDVRREQKKAKLLQYGERIWNITEGSEDERIDLAISKTREFFESLGIKTRLSDYGVTSDKIDEILASLESHGMTKLGETQDLGLDDSRKILEKAL